MRAICLQARAEVSVQEYKRCSNRMKMTNDRISAKRPEGGEAGLDSGCSARTITSC